MFERSFSIVTTAVGPGAVGHPEIFAIFAFFATVLVVVNVPAGVMARKLDDPLMAGRSVNIVAPKCGNGLAWKKLFQQREELCRFW